MGWLGFRFRVNASYSIITLIQYYTVSVLCRIQYYTVFSTIPPRGSVRVQLGVRVSASYSTIPPGGSVRVQVSASNVALCSADCCRKTSVRESVCLSVTRRYCLETAKHIIKLIS